MGESFRKNVVLFGDYVRCLFRRVLSTRSIISISNKNLYDDRFQTDRRENRFVKTSFHSNYYVRCLSRRVSTISSACSLIISVGTFYALAPRYIRLARWIQREERERERDPSSYWNNTGEDCFCEKRRRLLPPWIGIFLQRNSGRSRRRSAVLNER